MKLTYILSLVLLFTSSAALSSKMVYTPINPSFGGNPINGSILLNKAQAQNKFKESQAVEEEKSALEDFNDRLQRSLLNRLSSTLSSSFVDDDGSLVPGTTETTDFIIEIVDQGDGSVSVTTTDRITGDFTTFTVQSL